VRLKALDDGGFRPASLSWTVADPSVASITDSTLTAIAVGTTSVTATAGTLSGQLDVTVLSDAVLPIGTIKWSVQPAAGFVDTGSVTVNANDEATSFVKMEAKWDPSIGEWGAYSPIRIRGLSAAGDTTFFTSTGLAANERPGLGSVMGDVTGGILMLVVKEPTTQAEWDYDQLHGGSPVSLVKVGTQRDSPGWRYPVGRGNDVPSALAQGKDGTVWGLRQFSSEIYAVDTSTGREKFRVTAPLSSAHYRSATCPQLNYDTSFHSPFLAPFSGVRIDRDGFVDVMVLQTDSTVGVIVSGDGNCTIVEYTVMSKVSTVSLYRISPTGSSQVIELGHYTTQGRSVTSGTGSSPLPDDTGGVLASWVVCEGQDVCDLRARHIGATGLGTEFSLSGGSHPIGEILAGPSVSGTGRVAYDSGGAIDMVSGARLWSKSPPSFPLPAATLESGRTLYTEIGALGPQGTIFDASGAVIATNQPVLVEWDALLFLR